MAVRSFLSEEGKRIQIHRVEVFGDLPVLYDLENQRWLQSETYSGRWRKITQEEKIQLNNRSRLYIRHYANNKKQVSDAAAAQVSATDQALGTLTVPSVIVGESVHATQQTATTSSPTVSGRRSITNRSTSVFGRLGSSQYVAATGPKF